MKKKIIVSIILSLVVAFSFVMGIDGALAQTANIDARAYVLADFYSGEIVDSKNENARYPIASMVKITTLSLVFDAINEGRLKYDDDVVISDYAFSMGGSQAFLDKGGRYKAEELIKSVIVASANDSCVALAEHLEGSVENFVSKMNDKAKQLGMENTNYINCTGLPGEGGYSSAKDVLSITRNLMSNEKFFEYAKVWMYDIEHSGGRTTSLTNTNKLVRFYNGMDGGKTGYTNEALSCLSCRATRGETSLVCVVIGSQNSKSRNATVSSLLNSGFSKFENRVLARKGEDVGVRALVKNGKTESVECEFSDNLKIFTNKNSKENVTESVEFFDVCAPISKGQVVGNKIFTLDNGKEYKVEIVAKNEVKSKNYADYINDFAKNW